MAQFGKADIGLIKATAGAEQSQFVDDNLVTGMLVGDFVSELNKKAQVQAGIQAGIKKDIDEKFKSTSTNLPEEFSKNLVEFVPGMKNSYAGVNGSGVMGKNEQAKIIANHDDYLAETDILVGIIKDNDADLAVDGVGHNAKSSQYLNQMKAGDYQVFTAYDKTGKPSPNVAVPMKVKPRLDAFEFEYNGGTHTLKELQGDHEGTPEQMAELHKASEQARANYDKAAKGYDDWSKIKDKVDGRPNPEKYQIYNSKTLPNRESNKQNASAELDIYMKNVSELKGDSDHNNIGDAGMYGKKWKNQVDGYSGLDLQHTLFTDASDDDVDNAYGDLFVNQTAKDPSIYKNDKGEFITFAVVDGNNNKTEVQYSTEEGSDWMKLGEEEQKKLLEMHIRGQRPDGSFNPDENSDFHKNGYANFMGNVTRDAALIKQRNYFENKGMYFDNGDGNPVNSAEVQVNRKQIAYTDHKFNSAFPERLLGGENFNENLTADGSIGKALREEFPDADLSFIGSGMIEVKGVETPFDLNGPNKKQELKRLKQHLQDYQLTDVENSLAKNMSNSTKDEDWKKMRRKGFNYHPHGQTTSDYLQFEGSTGNIVTGKLQVNGYDEETKMWEVTDTNGVTHEVDEDTLYPNGI